MLGSSLRVFRYLPSARSCREFGGAIAAREAYTEPQDPKFKTEKTHDESKAGKEGQEAGKREAADSRRGSFHQAVDVDSLVF